jgi:hypothetical protein
LSNGGSTATMSSTTASVIALPLPGISAASALSKA